MASPPPDEHGMLRDSAAAFAARHGGAERLRRGDGAARPAVWREAAEAGFLDMLLPEDHGGAGLGLDGVCVVAEQCGRHLLPEPIGAAAIARGAVVRGGSPLADADGAVVLPALLEAPHDPARNRTTAVRDGDGLRLDGVKTGVASADGADILVASARAPDGEILAATARRDAKVAPAWAVDGTTTARVVFRNAPARLVADGTTAPFLAALCLATAAELLGVMDAAREIALGHLRIRRQFGRPIGSFQALRHRAVDDLAAVETSRALVRQAARAIDAGANAPDLGSAALSHAAGRALATCKSAIQIHGAVGFTDEHDIGYFLKRAMTLSVRWGGVASHRRLYRKASRDGDAGAETEPWNDRSSENAASHA